MTLIIFAGGTAPASWRAGQRVSLHSSARPHQQDRYGPGGSDAACGEIRRSL
jgi:hypothetical protein